MAKRNFAALMLASIAAAAFPVNVRADQAFAGADGCTVLSQIVYSEVTAAAWGGPPVSSSVGEAFSADVSTCNRTARTVSKAFALAMTNVGSDIYWRYPSEDPGDYCWSGFLDQCYPRRAPLGADADTWMAVSATIRYAMPSGPASDQSIFSGGAMRQALRSVLSGDVHLYQGSRGPEASFSRRESQTPAIPMNGDVTSPGK